MIQLAGQPECAFLLLGQDQTLTKLSVLLRVSSFDSVWHFFLTLLF